MKAVFGAFVLLVVVQVLQAQVWTLDSTSPLANGEYGTAVASIPDVDGDDWADIAVGAPHENALVGMTTYTNAGRVHIYSGRTGCPLGTLQSPNAQNGGRFGVSLATISNLDAGNTLEELVVGASDETVSGAPLSGRVYVFSTTSWTAIRTISNPNPGSSGSIFGRRLARVPSVNAGSIDEVVIGASMEDYSSLSDSGRAYIYDVSGGSPVLLASLASPTAQAGGQFGGSVSGIGDVNGDGYGDVLIGASGESSGAGHAYLFSGSSASWLATHSSTSSASGDAFGVAVAGLPDLDSDGVPDYLIGSPGEDELSGMTVLFTDSGAAYFVSGSTGSMTRLTSNALQNGGAFGRRLAVLNEVNCDSTSGSVGDFAVGASGETVSSVAAAGRVHVFDGGTRTWKAEIVSPRLTANSEFGGSGLAGSRDSGSNCRGDLLVGAVANGYGTASFGRAFAFNLDYFSGFCSDPECLGDTDHSGVVDFGDITEVIVHWGNICP